MARVLILVTRASMFDALEDAGFSTRESMAIFHEHVAPLSLIERGDLLSSIYAGVVGKTTTEGRLMLVTSRGLL